MALSAKTVRSRAADVGRYIGLTIVIIAWVVPVAWVVITSFKPKGDIFTNPPTLIFSPTFDNYITAVTGYGILHGILNSAIITVTNSILALLVSIPAAYAYASLRFRFSKFLSFYTLLTQMAPPISLLIPIYFMYSKTHLLGSYAGLVIVYLTITIPFSIWILISYFQDVPKALEEAAYVDGASRLSTLVRIIVPQVRGGIAVAAIFAFINSWNEFIYALTLSGYETQTVTVAIFSFLGADQSLWGPFAATGTMIMIPLILVAFFAQKHIVRGMSFGGVKG